MAKERASAFEIAGFSVEPGSRRQFDLPAAQLYTHTPLDMPIEVIHGTTPGPALLVCAALHGDELNGVEIIRRLRVQKSLERIRGTLVLVPAVNLLGFVHRSRYLPDRRDLNRCFPGTEKGSLGSRLAYLFFNEIVLRCSHVVDLHTGAVHRENVPQIRAALDDVVGAMARGFGLPVIVNSGLIDGSLRAEADKRKIPVITYEAGEALRLDEAAIVAGVRGITGVMRALGMLRATRARKLREPFIASSTSWYRAPTDGLFRPLAKLGARVEAGQYLCAVADPFGGSETEVPATAEGVVIGVNKIPLVNEGEALYHVARFAEAGSVENEIVALNAQTEGDPLFEMSPVPDVPG